MSNAWRSDVTAAAEVHAQADVAARVGDVRVADPLREEEIELLERVDPAEAQAARREVGGRMDCTHRRPERAAAQPAPGRQLGRSVDGSD
ncbi:hypothetical protein GCM10022236_12670 [Microlunatus ginsengisoli]|uniref:Uncharacterized protein n=1 Tax=Microlunatus ginsengisoli TaxID=363863 RepID=A0ABP6ZP64_9ACTN